MKHIYLADQSDLRPVWSETNLIWNQSDLRPVWSETSLIWDQSDLRPVWSETSLIWDQSDLRPDRSETSLIWDLSDLRPVWSDWSLRPVCHSSFSDQSFIPVFQTSLSIFLSFNFHPLFCSTLGSCHYFSIPNKSFNRIEFNGNILYIYVHTYYGYSFMYIPITAIVLCTYLLRL